MAVDKWEKLHRRELARIQKQILAIYEAAAKEAAAIGMTVGELTDDLFTFDKYPITHDRINKLLKDLHDKIESVVVDGVNSSWTLANNKNSELARMVLGASVGKLSQAQYRRYFSNNDSARQAFLARKHQGLGLSDSVWHYTTLYKREIEMGLDVGIRNGVSAVEMAKELKSYLQHPDKLFRRVRDQHGELILSKAAKAFHPGQGVYRSSYMNARRLAATETNMAYRTADHERWQQLDFVVGIEVHLSGNHTAKGHKGVFIDICDELEGRYPKDFKFTGWHPFCRCYSTSILKTPAEMEADEQRILAGREPQEWSENQVTDVPDGFKQWLKDNEGRIGRAQSMPYFLRDNGTITVGKKLVAGKLVPWNRFELKEFKQPQKVLSPLDIAAQRHAARTPQQIAQIQARADARQQLLKDYALTEKRAGNILNMASGWHEVSFVALQGAVDVVASSKVYRSSEIAELKKALQATIAEIKQQQAAEKALADVIPDVHKWHQQFTIMELQEVKAKVSDKLVQWDNLPLSEKLKKIENEINYVSDGNFWKPHKIYPTWEVAVSAYKKQLDIVNNAIAWMPVDTELATIKAYLLAHPKSAKISQLIAEAEKIKANGGLITQVKAKIDAANAIKAKNDASVISHAKKEAEKKVKELEGLKQKKADIEQKKKGVEGEIKAGQIVGDKKYVQLKQDELKKIEDELSDVERRIDKLGGGSPFTSDAYSQARKDAALWTKTKDSHGRYDREPGDNYFRPFAEQDWARWSQNEREVVFNYTSGSSYINEPLYTKYLSTKYGVHGEVRSSWDDINTLTEMIDKSTPFTRDVWLNRGASKGEFLGQFGISLDPSNPNKIVGAIGEQKPFMSTGHSKSWGFVDTGKEAQSPVVYNIYCPKGTKGIYTEPYSAFGGLGSGGYAWDGKSKATIGREVEVILQRGTRLRVTKAEYKNGKWFIDMEVIEQPVKIPFQP